MSSGKMGWKNPSWKNELEKCRLEYRSGKIPSGIFGRIKEEQK